MIDSYNCGSKFVKAVHSDSLKRLEFVSYLYLKGRGKVGFIFGIFRFFKIPLQMAIGLYLAFMMLVGTVAGIAFFAEGIERSHMSSLVMPETCGDREIVVCV